jgi:anti-sigma regulatory factor (Ser/Thr protein kinase)
VSELVTNGVRHAQLGDDAVIDLEVAVEPERVRVQVSDEGPGFDPPTSWPPPPDSVGGRGLFIVNQLASRWGVDRGRSTCVWFELDRP